MLGFLFRAPLLAALGSYLVKAEAPGKADVALVLSGDASGQRIRTAAELVRQGYAPRVLVSGPGGMYGYHECDLSIPFAVKAGYPESYFVHVEHNANSTAEEAREVLEKVREFHAHKVLLVTSNYHTRRAGRIFRGAAPELEWIVVAAPDDAFTPEGWWHSRPARKVFFYEWAKTVANWLGI